jgi:hypothetical protein
MNHLWRVWDKYARSSPPSIIILKEVMIYPSSSYSHPPIVIIKCLNGMYVMALIGRACTNWADQKQIKFFGVKFKSMTKLGSVLTCKGTVKRKKEENGEKLITVSVEAIDQNGEVKAGGDLIVACA